MSETDSTPICVYYDGACPLCRREIHVYRRMTPHAPVEFREVSGFAPEEAVAPDLDGATAMRRFHVRDADGALRDGAERVVLETVQALSPQGASVLKED